MGYKDRQKKREYDRKWHAKDRHGEINEWIYAFDIETSNTKNDPNFNFYDFDKKRPLELTFMHQFTVSRLNWTNGKVEHYFAGNFIEQLFEIFDQLLSTGKTTIVISHNYGGYESRLVNQYDYIIQRTSSILCSSPTKVLTQTLKPTDDDMDRWGGDDYAHASIKILDSLLILQKSIKKLGGELGYEKLQYDYDEFKLPTDSFTDDEIEYCYRDNDISLLGLYNKCKLYSWISTPNDIPVSSTGFVRKELKYNKSINVDNCYKHWSALCKRMYIRSKPILNTFQEAFNGGFTHASPYFVGQVVHDLATVDFKSDYPAQIVNHAFPKEPFVPVLDKNAQERKIRRYRDIAQRDWREVLGMKKLLNYQTVGRYVFRGVKAKHFPNKNIFPIISISKTQVDDIYVGRNVISENGKVIQADSFIFSCTDVELVAILMVYDIVKIEVLEMYEAECGNMHKEIVNAINYFGIQKEQWKKVTKDLRKGCYDRSKYDLPEEQLNVLESSSDKVACADQYLQNAKASLNGIYGQQVQKQIQDDYILTESGECVCLPKTLEEATKDLRNLNHSFPIGIFVTSWARLSITLGFLMQVEAGCSFIYADTDSLKILPNGRREELESMVKNYNQIILSLNPTQNQHGFGIFDFETDYESFVSLGAKKYLVCLFEENEWKIEMTVAGLPKHEGSHMYQRLFAENYGWDFDAMVKDCFNHNTLLRSDITGKLGHSDYYMGYDMSRYYPVLKGHDVKSMINLDDAEFYINSTSSPVSAGSMYCQILDKVFGNPQNTEKTEICYDDISNTYTVRKERRNVKVQKVNS